MGVGSLSPHHDYLILGVILDRHAISFLWILLEGEEEVNGGGEGEGEGKDSEDGWMMRGHVWGRGFTRQRHLRVKHRFYVLILVKSTTQKLIIIIIIISKLLLWTRPTRIPLISVIQRPGYLAGRPPDSESSTFIE